MKLTFTILACKKQHICFKDSSRIISIPTTTTTTTWWTTIKVVSCWSLWEIVLIGMHVTITTILIVCVTILLIVSLFLLCIYYDRAGVDIPTIEVRFEHLNVQSQVQVGKRALPTITNYMLHILEVSRACLD
jgi:hypothetical protein